MKLKQPDDRELGMHVAITRRDFMNGMLMTTGAALAGAPSLGVGATSAAYPPALTGLRGSHAGSFERAHALALGIAHVTDAPREDDDYDLVVVGAGLSGLAAAHLYRQRVPAARILLLDTHDPINDRFPHRHKRFIRSGSVQHTALGGSLFYTAEIDGVPLHQWMGDFVNQKAGWVDLIQDLIPTPF